MDIREHLKTLPIRKLRDLARRHNKLYRIKIGQTKDELVESLAKQYEKLTGTHLIPRRGIDLVIEPIKITKKQLPKLEQKKEPTPINKEELQQIKKDLKENTAFERAKKIFKIHKKPPKIIKEQLKEFEVEKKIDEVIKQVKPPQEEPAPTKAEKGLASLVQSKISKDDVNKSFKEFVELLKQNKPSDNLKDLNRLKNEIHEQILRIFYNQLFAKNKGKLTQEVINKTNKQIEELAEEYTDDNEDLIYINDFVSDKFQNTVRNSNLDFNRKRYYYRYGVKDSLSNYFKDTLFYIKNKEESEARTFRADISRLSDKKFEKRSAWDSVAKSSREILSQLKQKQDDIEKYGNYPYLQEYIDKFNEAMKIPIFAKRIKQAQKE